jgi:predicted regulator of Ras-like GTPase activity (Roadblock/LC7/MglB family)
MSATILNTAENITHKLKNASSDRIIMEFDVGRIIIMKAGQKSFISTILTHEESLDSVITELENAAGRLKKAQ